MFKSYCADSFSLHPLLVGVATFRVDQDLLHRVKALTQFRRMDKINKDVTLTFAAPAAEMSDTTDPLLPQLASQTDSTVCLVMQDDSQSAWSVGVEPPLFPSIAKEAANIDKHEPQSETAMASATQEHKPERLGLY